MMTTQFDAIKCSAVIYPEGAVYIAQCLEYDIVSQGKTITQANQRLIRSIAATVCVCVESGKKPFEGVPAAPRQFWEMFESATLEISSPEHPMRLPQPMPAIRPVTRLIENRAA
jgi:hypothetical protein